MKKIILSASFLVACTLPGLGHKTTPDWMKNAVFYDIYPCSFMDSDGNGKGDLEGIISRLDYIKSLGVDAIWMNPIFVSGWFDGGYDIIDYYTIDPRFGTNKDVNRLVEEAHKRGIKVCLDLVPGHTSVESPWFQLAVSGPTDGKYSDYYIFTDKVTDKDKADIAKRNKSENPATDKTGIWVETQDAVKGGDGKLCAKYYQKNYYVCQPALNFGYANPDPSKPWEQSVDAPGPKAVRRELKNIMAYWFDRGVDGFRVDMASSLIKNDEDKKETIKLWQDIRQWLDREYPGKVLISEWGVPQQSLKAGFDTDFMLRSHSLGYSDLMSGSKGGKTVQQDAYFERSGKGRIDRFVEDYNTMYQAGKEYGTISLFSANHDVNRLNSETRNRPEDMKVFFTFLLTMPGTPFIHFGDEIMLRNVRGLKSVEGSREERAGARTPMQWDNTQNAGFSTAAPEDLFLPVYTDNGKLTVATQDKDPNSVLNYVRKMIKLRHDYPELGNAGEWVTISDVNNPYPWVYTRTSDTATFYVVLNPGDKKVATDFIIPQGSTLKQIGGNGKVKLIEKKGKVRLSLGGTSSAIYELVK